jgi:predicted nucleotide-binding protein
MNPYNKVPLHKLRQTIEALLQTVRDDEKARNSYKSYPVTAVSAACGTLEKWLKAYPLSKGASYQKTLQDTRSLLPQESGFGRHVGTSLSLLIYKKALAKLAGLVKKVDAENRNVFIVHGRDHAVRDDVQRVLHSLSIPTIVLEKEGDAGQTVVEKFEREAARCEYALIICSPDDEGRLRTKSKKTGPAANDGLRPRARQNVVLELGYFLAQLGRKNVFMLHTGGIEQPSDLAGVIYQPGNSNWQQKLVRELRDAGFVISQPAADRL